jgi:hypothetical protein
MCEGFRINRWNTDVDRYEVEGWVRKANSCYVDEASKGIYIAATPDELPRSTALALVGGNYHEAWHTKYSRRTLIRLSEVYPRVVDLIALIPNDPDTGHSRWSKLTGPLLEWSNIIEDIRIERCGCKRYPGAKPKMEALQDLILDQETEGRTVAEHKGLPVNDDLAAVMGTFRDVGLGYDTPKQQLALRNYRQRSPEGYAFVMEGPLRPLLDRAIALGPKDDMECMWLAMEVVAAITAASPPPPEPPKPPKAPPGTPPPPIDPNAQPELPDPVDEDDDEPEESQNGPTADQFNKPILYKVGDRAIVQTGPHAGCEVEVVRAGLPDDDGVQDLEFALVEPD